MQEQPLDFTFRACEFKNDSGASMNRFIKTTCFRGLNLFFVASDYAKTYDCVYFVSGSRRIRDAAGHQDFFLKKCVKVL